MTSQSSDHTHHEGGLFGDKKKKDEPAPLQLNKMMSLIDLDDDQRWVPTHVNVTVLRARGLRTKGKHGSRYLYTIIQVGKEKYTTGLVEKADVPVWNEECCFELLPGILEDGGRSAYPPGSGDLVLTVMHRVLIGLDVFLGQTIVPLDKIFQEGACPREEWFKLNSKVGRKEKERGELQVTVQFTRNNMTASMFDLTMKDKPRSAFGKLKDRVTGRKRGDVESSSAIVPGRYAALSGSVGQPFGEEGGGGGVESQSVEIPEKKSKMKDFFKGRLQKSSDTKSCSSLASESSMSSMASDNLGSPPSLDLLSDPPSSPIYTSKVRVDPHYGETDLAKKVLTSQHTTKILTHKRAFSDEASKITTAFPKTNAAVESLKGRTMTQSKSSLCINGSHVYDSEPSTPKSSGALPSKLVLLEKCSPLSRSLQNLTKRSEDKSSFAEGRRWSFDKLKKDEKEEEKEARASSGPDRPLEAAAPIVSSAGSSPDKGRKLRKTLFSAGRSDSLPAKSELNQAGSTSEGKFRGWFGSGDSQNKPRLEVSPKVESSSDVLPFLPPCSPVPPQGFYPSASPPSQVPPEDHGPIGLFTPSSSPSSTPLSPSNPFLLCIQRNPFFEELVAEESETLSSVAPCSSSGSSISLYTTLPAQLCTPDIKANATNMVSIKRERPRPVAKQISLPALSPKAATPDFPNHSAPCSAFGTAENWDDSFDAFASSRLNSPKGRLLPEQPRTSPTLCCKRSRPPLDDIVCNYAQETQTCKDEPPPLPPRRLVRTPVNEIFSDGWLHRGQELAVHKEAYLLSQTGVASLQRGRESEGKRSSISPDPHTSSESSDSLSAHAQSHTNNKSLGFTSEEKLKKFKYEPLEDETSWGGMLFEQDLYGRVCRRVRTYGQQRVNTQHLSLNAEEIVGNRTLFKNVGSKELFDGDKSVSDFFSVSPISPSNVPDISYTPAEEDTNSCETSCLNNNISFSLTLGDLNMNVNNSDFSFIDSDGSSQSEVINVVQSVDDLNPSFPTEDPQPVIYHKETKPEDMFTLKDTYIPAMNSSFEITVSSKKLCKVPPVCKDNCQDCQCELDNVALHVYSKDDTKNNPASNSFDVKTECREEHVQRNDGDYNGNLEDRLVKRNQSGSFSGVVSARIRPKGLSRQNSSDSTNSQSRNTDRDFEQFLSLVQNLSEVSEGPSSYQPTKSVLSSLQALEQTDMLKVSPINDSTYQIVSKTQSQICLKDSLTHVEGNPSQMSFEDLHAKVAPSCRTPCKAKIEESLQEPELCCPSTRSALSLSAHAPACCPHIYTSATGPGGGASCSVAVALCTPSSSSSSTTFSTDQPLVDARHSLLPEETQPASSLPRQESRSHPVKPLTSSQAEKKEGRSVLEKLKCTINPGRSAHQIPPEPEKSQEVSADRAAQYQHLTNMELISLLLQQEMDMQKQQAASEQQEAQRDKCEAELKKVKLQVRDLEDYIDNLLLRIMEQTPTLLQVRSRHK